MRGEKLNAKDRWRGAAYALASTAFWASNMVIARALIKAHAGRLALTGTLGITLFNTFIYYAGRSTSAANMSLISIIFPIVIVALSCVVYGERIAPRQVAGIVVVILGVLFLLSKGRPAGTRLNAFQFATFAFVFSGEPLGVVHAVSFALIIGIRVLAGGWAAKKPAAVAN